MARTAVPVVTINRSGVVPAAAVSDAANDLTIPNDGRVWFEVQNASATTPFNVEVEFVRTVDGSTVTKKTFSIPANTANKRFGPWPQGDYGDAVAVNVDDANLKVTAFRLA